MTSSSTMLRYLLRHRSNYLLQRASPRSLLPETGFHASLTSSLQSKYLPPAYQSYHTLTSQSPLSPRNHHHHHNTHLLPSQPYRTMFIQTQTTPNADALMFRPGTTILPPGVQSGVDYPSIRQAQDSPLARQLFTIDGVRSIYYGPDFITITKDENLDWKLLKPEIFEVIMDYFTSNTLEDGSVRLFENADEIQARSQNDTRISEDDSEVVAMIKELLETRIKPAVAEDGGSILYRGFDEESGVVKLELQGACSTCSSSSITLKNGVENMLSHYVPEVKKVVEVVSGERRELEEKNIQALQDMEKKLEQAGVLRS